MTSSKRTNSYRTLNCMDKNAASFTLHTCKQLSVVIMIKLAWRRHLGDTPYIVHGHNIT